MRRIALWLAATATVVALLFAYRTSLPGTRRGGGADGAGASPAPSGAVSVDGPRVETAWGPVQVRLVAAGDRIVDVVVLLAPTGHDAINADALPRLRAEVLTAQSADVAGVSGATVTTDGYLRSLRGALAGWHAGTTAAPTGAEPTTAPPTGPEPGESGDD